MKASVHTTDVVASSCPTAETPNESTTYSIPFQGAGLSPGYAKFYIFMRNVAAGTSVTMRILNPNGTVFNMWSYNFTTYYASSYYGFSKVLPTISGIYTFEANYNGIICSQPFEIVNPLSVAEILNTAIVVYPNPSHDKITIKLQQALVNGKWSLINELGQQVLSMEGLSGKEFSIDRGNLKGTYFLQLAENDQIVLTRKIIFTDF